MKRFAAAIILFVLVISLSITEKLYLDSLSNKLFESIETTDSLYPKSPTSAESSAKKAVDLWESNKIWLSIFVNHDKLDEISEGFILLKMRCKGAEHEFRLAVSDLNFLIEDLVKEESLSIYSFL